MSSSSLPVPAPARADASELRETLRLARHGYREPTVDEPLYEKLCEIARAGATIDYTSVFGDPNEARQPGRPLGEISMFDHIHGCPLVAVVAVRRDTGFPGAGFTNWTHEHDAGHYGRRDTRVLLLGEDELTFVVRQRKAVDRLWQH